MAYPTEPVEWRNKVDDSRWQPKLKDGRTLWGHPSDRWYRIWVHEQNVEPECLPVLKLTRRGAKRVAYNQAVAEANKEMRETWKPVRP